MVRADVSDHEPGGLDPQGHQRCATCGYRWPCPDVRAQVPELDDDEKLLLEIADIGIGHTIWKRDLGSDSNIAGGVVIGWVEDDDEGDIVRTYLVLDFPQARPAWHRIRADEIEPATVGLPNTMTIRGYARRLAGVIHKQKGVVSSEEIDHAETVLTLLRSIG